MSLAWGTRRDEQVDSAVAQSSAQIHQSPTIWLELGTSGQGNLTSKLSVSALLDEKQRHAHDHNACYGCEFYQRVSLFYSEVNCFFLLLQLSLLLFIITTY